MMNNIYLSLSGANQGLISRDCSTYDSIGNYNQTAHPDEILVYELVNKNTREQSRVHKSLTFKKAIDRSSPLLITAISNNEKMNATFEFHTTNDADIQSLSYRIRLINATIDVIDFNYPHILTHKDAQPMETISLKYESILYEYPQH